MDDLEYIASLYIFLSDLLQLSSLHPNTFTIQNVLLGSFKSLFQLDHQVDIGLYLMEAITLCHSKKLAGLKPSWCTVLSVSLAFSASWNLKSISFHWVLCEDLKLRHSMSSSFWISLFLSFEHEGEFSTSHLHLRGCKNLSGFLLILSSMWSTAFKNSIAFDINMLYFTIFHNFKMIWSRSR